MKSFWKKFFAERVELNFSLHSFAFETQRIQLNFKWREIEFGFNNRSETAVDTWLSTRTLFLHLVITFSLVSIWIFNDRFSTLWIRLATDRIQGGVASYEEPENEVRIQLVTYFEEDSTNSLTLSVGLKAAPVCPDRNGFPDSQRDVVTGGCCPSNSSCVRKSWRKISLSDCIVWTAEFVFLALV